MTDTQSHQTPGQIFRFLLVGGANTLITGALFLGLSSIVASTLAYTVAFIVGVVFAVVVTPRLVFRARASTTQRVRYVFWYLAVYVLGLVFVYVLHDRWMLTTPTVALVTFATTAGLSFLGARFLFDKRPGPGVGSPNSNAGL